MSITLKKIAEALGLNVSTVSRALKNHQDISDYTKRRVQEVAKQLKYEPNVYAIKLRTNKSKILGVMVPHISNLFYDSFIQAVEEEGKKAGYTLLILQSSEDTNSELENLDTLKKNKVDGILVSLSVNTTDIAPFLDLHNSGIPIIFFDRVPNNDRCIKVCFDDENIGILAAKALIKKQKQYILAIFWGNDAVHLSNKRLLRFKETFANTASKTVLDIRYHQNAEDAKTITLQAFQQGNPYDAIFCTGDSALIGTMHALTEKGIKIPDEIAVISISNGLIPTLYNPSITYIETSGYNLGKMSFLRILDYWAGDTTINEILVNALLIEKCSL